MSYAAINDRFDGPLFHQAWRAKDGTACATVHLGRSHITFEDAAHARALAAECLTAADAMDALPQDGPRPVPPAQDGAR